MKNTYRTADEAEQDKAHLVELCWPNRRPDFQGVGLARKGDRLRPASSKTRGAVPNSPRPGTSLSSAEPAPSGAGGARPCSPCGWRSKGAARCASAGAASGLSTAM
jgi:hypothetical protein